MSNAVHRGLGLSAAAVIIAALVYGGVSAQERRTAEAKAAACNSLKDEKRMRRPRGLQLGRGMGRPQDEQGKTPGLLPFEAEFESEGEDLKRP